MHIFSIRLKQSEGKEGSNWFHLRIPKALLNKDIKFFIDKANKQKKKGKEENRFFFNLT